MWIELTAPDGKPAWRSHYARAANRIGRKLTPHGLSDAPVTRDERHCDSSAHGDLSPLDSSPECSAAKAHVFNFMADICAPRHAAQADIYVPQMKSDADGAVGFSVSMTIDDPLRCNDYRCHANATNDSLLSRVYVSPLPRDATATTESDCIAPLKREYLVACPLACGSPAVHIVRATKRASATKLKDVFNADGELSRCCVGSTAGFSPTHSPPPCTNTMTSDFGWPTYLPRAQIG